MSLLSLKQTKEALKDICANIDNDNFDVLQEIEDELADDPKEYTKETHYMLIQIIQVHFIIRDELVFNLMLVRHDECFFMKSVNA